MLTTLRDALLPPDWITLPLTLLWAAAFLLALRRAPRWLIPIAVAPYVAVLVWCTNVRVYSIHGMIHTGIVYQVMTGGVPPENPFFAGVPVHYPWLYHALVAWIAQPLDIAPSWLFMAGNLLSLVAICVLLAKISNLYVADRVTAALAVFLAVFGSFGIEVANLMRAHGVPGFWSVLAAPFAQKFSNVNMMPAGLALFLLGVYCLLRALSATGPAHRAQVGLFVALAGSALLYPWTWLGLVAIAAAAIGWTLLRDATRRRNAAIAAALGIVSTALLLPYLQSLTAGKAPGTGLTLETHPAGLLSHGVHVVLMLVPTWALIAARSPALLAELRSGAAVPRLLVLAAATSVASFVLVRQVSGAEYKLRALAGIVLAVLAAPALATLYRRHFAVACALIAYLLWPAMHDLVHKMTVQRPIADPFVEQGYALRHADPDEDAMYQWILAHTPADAVFLDTEATVPVFARRPVWVVGDVGKRWNGWNHPPEEWLYWVHGVAQQDLADRRRIVAGLYRQVQGVAEQEIEAALHEVTSRRPVYALARDAHADAVLAGWPFLARVAQGKGWSVYRWSPGS